MTARRGRFILRLMRRRLLAAGLIGCAALSAAVVFWRLDLLDRIEGVTWAWRVRLRARPGIATSKIKIILLDQASLDWARRESHLSWPWPREVYAAILDFCERGGARAVAFDVILSEPSYMGVDDDARLAAAISRTRGFVGAVFLGDHDGETVAWPEGVSDGGWTVRGLDGWLACAPAEALATRATFPIPEVSENALLLGNVSESPEADGIFRRARLFRVFDGRWVPSLALAVELAARRMEESGGNEIELSPGWLRVGPRRVPIDDLGRAWLRFRGPSGTHETFSAAAVIQSEMRLREGSDEPAPVSPAAFKDAYVFFGFGAPGLLDLRPTPVSRVYPGVEIHATALDNLLSGDFVRELPLGAGVAATALLTILSAAATVFARRAVHGAAAFVLGLGLPFALGFALYDAGWVFPVAPVSMGVFFSLTSGLIYNYATEGRQKAFLKQAFRHYLSPVVIERLLQDPSQLRLGGERRELTIFFSDLQGFSAISEKLDPESLTRLLNDYLTDMTDIILEEGGTLDKYEGDAIIAFWNAPLAQPDHPVRAVRAALRCQRRLADRRAEFRERSGVDLFMRVGLHTGEVVVGNMGSRERFDYTVLGDAANLASRLEGANKAFGTFIMVSETTWAAASPHFIGRELALLRVVGRRTPVRVFEPTDAERAPEEWAEFGRGREAYAAGRFEEAVRIFERLPHDPVSRAYAARCRALAANPPKEWDGVWALSEK